MEMEFSQGLTQIIVQITGDAPPFLALLLETTARSAPKAQPQ
jgi:hypothetical protein